ncbi:uncharacterized protein EV154DRAFT_581861, partial [Mucor mucedo]|uniref:uncharacterized protein n=1 Tax=Mucor mucedo TaxID=29922 RepID=UPI002220DAA4
VMGDKPRRVRAPPRRLKVTGPVLDIWEKMGASQASLSLKDWIILDKKVQKDIKDGLRFLRGRKPRKGRGPANGVPQGNLPNPTPAVVNLVQDATSELDSETDTDTESSTTTSGYESYSESSLDEESDNDSVYDYPYERVLMVSSSPLAILGMVKDYPVKLVLDSGSAISVINRSFAERLGLVGSGKVLNIKTIETTKMNCKRNQCEITVSVPVRI